MPACAHAGHGWSGILGRYSTRWGGADCANGCRIFGLTFELCRLNFYQTLWLAFLVSGRFHTALSVRPTNYLDIFIQKIY